jgi:type II secretory pathway pseudopilin PulG
MRGSKRSPTAPKSAEAGFSFIEILVALLLSSVLGLVLWSGLAGTQGLMRKTIQRASLSLKLLQLDTGLRQALGRVRLPFWVQAETAVSRQGGLLTIAWLDGDPDKKLTLQQQDRRVLIGETGTIGSFGPFPGVRLEVFRDERGRPLGVEVAVDRGEETVTILARFGSNPL